MRNARTFFNILFLVFFTVAIFGGLFFADLAFAQRVPGGADFIVPWKGMQDFMLQGVTPYGEKTTLNIQNIIYKRTPLAGQYPYQVNIPLFLLVFFLPLSWIRDLVIARAIWMIIIEVGLFGVVLASLRLTRWKPHWLFFILILIFCLFWQPSVSALVSGTSVILQALLFCIALRSLELGTDELAGGLLALSLLNIEATGFVFLTTLIWIFSTQRWRVLGGIGMMLAILFGLSLILLPSWILPFFGSVISNWKSGAMPSTYALFEGWLPGIGRRLAQILAIGALTILFLEWRSVRGQDVRWLFWTICLTAALTPLTGIPYFSNWLVFTLPGMLLVISIMVQRWRLLGFISSVIVMVCAFLGLWAAQINGITSGFILFYPLLLTLFLYWVRWGAVRQPRLWADEIALRG
ncbi:MAG: hypothetical protein NTW32_25170 [Chloroflexi bacterium]|nr:hypothetical protein [Chloroflexota bacterium]